MFHTLSSMAVKSVRDCLSTSLLLIGALLAVGEPVFAAEGKKPLRILLVRGQINLLCLIRCAHGSPLFATPNPGWPNRRVKNWHIWPV